MTWRRSSRRPNGNGLIDVPSRTHRPMHQRRPSGVIVPSVLPLASRAATRRPPCRWSRGLLPVAGARTASAPPRLGRRRTCASRTPSCAAARRPSAATGSRCRPGRTRPASARPGADDHLGRAPADVDHQARHRSSGCSRATPEKISRASSRPEMTSIGWPSTPCARARKASRLRASRSVCVTTASHLQRLEACQALREAGQAVQAALRGLSPR